MNPYAVAVHQPRRMLANLLGWLDKAQASAETRKFDCEVLAECRLAPDMFPLRRQVQAACDAAKFGAARVAGKTPPAHPDTEKTVAELRARVKSVIDYLDTFTPADFEGAADRRFPLPFLPEGKGVAALDYLAEMAAPNFMFHVTMTYAILRHNGVDVGKRDYLGGLTLLDL